MSKIRLDKTTAQYIADAVREKSGKDDALDFKDMAIEINNLEQPTLTYGVPHSASWVEDISEPFTFTSEAGKTLDNFLVQGIFTFTDSPLTPYRGGYVEPKIGILKPGEGGYYWYNLNLNGKEFSVRLESPYWVYYDRGGTFGEQLYTLPHYDLITMAADWDTIPLTLDDTVKPLWSWHTEAELAGSFYQFQVGSVASESKISGRTIYKWGAGARRYDSDDGVTRGVEYKCLAQHDDSEMFLYGISNNGAGSVFNCDGAYDKAADGQTGMSGLVDGDTYSALAYYDSNYPKHTFGIFFQTEDSPNAPANSGWVWVEEGHTVEEFRAWATEHNLLVHPVLYHNSDDEAVPLLPQTATDQAKWALAKTVEGENTLTISSPTPAMTGYSVYFTTQKEDDLSKYVHYGEVKLEGGGSNNAYLALAKTEEDLPTSTLRENF